MDAAYGVHWDSKGHTGMMMSLGKGAAMIFSHTHKLNGRSSTEAEPIGIDDALPYIMWGLYFFEAQGYEVTHNILFQDNKSTILRAKNGRWSSSKRMVPSTSTTGSFSSRTKLIVENLRSSTAGLRRCGVTCSQSHSRVRPTASSAVT